MKKTTRFVVGITVAVLAALAVFVAIAFLGGTTKTPINLAGSGVNCTPTKESVVHVPKGNNMQWVVKNDCDAPQTVMVGNFHLNTPGSTAGCGQTANDWPFKDDDLNNRQVTVPAGSSDKILLHEAKNASGAALHYQYDVCIGGSKKDPELVIDP